jgi:hypothetical protein
VGAGGTNRIPSPQGHVTSWGTGTSQTTQGNPQIGPPDAEPDEPPSAPPLTGPAGTLNESSGRLSTCAQGRSTGRESSTQSAWTLSISPEVIGADIITPAKTSVGTTSHTDATAQQISPVRKAVGHAARGATRSILTQERTSGDYRAPTRPSTRFNQNRGKGFRTTLRDNGWLRLTKIAWFDNRPARPRP